MLYGVSHRTICKFDTSQDANYLTIAETIEAEIRTATQETRGLEGSELQERVWKLTKKTNSDLQRLSKISVDSSRKLDELKGEGGLRITLHRGGSPRLISVCSSTPGIQGGDW